LFQNTIRGTSPHPPYEPQWQVVPKIVWDNVELVDVSATVGAIMQKLIDELINDAFSFLPDWAKDVVDAILGGIARFIVGLLAIPADVVTWLSDLLRVSIDPFSMILQLLTIFFRDNLVLYSMDVQHQIMGPVPATAPFPALPPVSVNINNLTADVEYSDTGEIVVGVTL
jgi:hypothetical protein